VSTLFFEEKMDHTIPGYNVWHDSLRRSGIMPKRKAQKEEKKPFGDRMAALRKQCGYSQRDLARETGISQRMIAYYEKQALYPPTHVLPILAKSLGVTVDQLLGIGNHKENKKKKDMRLWRRFTQIEKLDVKEKRKVIQLLDTFIEKELLKQKAQAQQ
jgi:transcriptional regulator with XRE-family HTH domain